MGKKTVSPGRKRIVAYFILVIVLPSIFLGGLAFRGIKNDRALIEQQDRNDLAELGRQIIHQTDEYISGIEKSFYQVASTCQIPQEPYFKDSALIQFVNQNQEVKGIFSFQNPEHVNWFRWKLQYLPNGIIKTKRDLDDPALEEGWLFEFRDKDYTSALQFYRDLLPGIEIEQSKIRVLTSIARLNKKLNQYEEAIETYRILKDNFFNQKVVGTIPAALIADLELNALYQKQGNDSLALLSLANVLTSLIQIDYSLDETGYYLLTEKIDAILDGYVQTEIGSLEFILDSVYPLQNIKQSLENSTKEILLTHQEVPEILKQRLSQQQKRDSIEDRFTLERNGKVQLLFVQGSNKEHSWGMIMNPEVIINKFLIPLLENESKAGRRSWNVKNREGQFIMSYNDQSSTYQNLVELDFGVSLPGFTLLGYVRPPTLLTSFMESGQGLYFYVFLIIIAVLIFGLLFTFKNVNTALQLAKMKSDFVATVSHEFKSPLTSIRQMVEMLDNDRVPTMERKKKYYKTILHQSARLTHLVDNVLDFSRIEKGRRAFQFKRSDFSQFLKETISDFRQRHVNQNVKLNLEIPNNLTGIKFDNEAIQQVVHNLLDNAVKYSGVSEDIDVTAKKLDDYIEVSIKDYGIGISPGEQSKIFERFYRGGNDTHDVKGSGIGLAIVKQILEAHGGSIKVDSKPGSGSTFQFSLPIDQNSGQ